MEKPAWYMAL